MNNGDINKYGNDASQRDCFLYHLHEKKIEYLAINDPLILWNNLRDIYIRIQKKKKKKTIILSKARYE